MVDQLSSDEEDLIRLLRNYKKIAPDSKKVFECEILDLVYRLMDDD